MASDNKIVFGLSNVHYSVVTETLGEDGYVSSYGPVKPWPGAVNLQLAADGNQKDFYADDIAYVNLVANAGYSGSLESAMIPDDVYTEVLGFKRAQGGGIAEYNDAVTKSIALLYEVKGDASKRRYVFYRVALTRPNEDAETITEDKEPKTQSIDIKASARPDDGLTKYRVEEGDSDYEDFFKNVVIPTFA